MKVMPSKEIIKTRRGLIMKLVEFSVTNYRSVTTAHKVPMQNLTVLVGKNNEGKSNILSALNVAMRAVMLHSRGAVVSQHFRGRYGVSYEWTRDFPIQFQSRKSGLESIFRLDFRLEDNERNEFHTITGIRGNEDIPISVKIGKDNIPKVEVPKRGSPAYNKKSAIITDFISKRISFNYIQAVRTEGMAIKALVEAIRTELLALQGNPDYLEAQQRVYELQQGVLDEMSHQLLEPLQAFLPSIRNITIKYVSEDSLDRFGRGDIDVVIDDGVATSIKNKGDGIKSLVTLAILKDRRAITGASVIAIEEPESHLHSGAIHSLVDVIHKIAVNSQVIITTHNPLFVQQNHVGSNILVDNGTARPAKNIAEIRHLLGVLPSDNLRNARYVIVVEGDDDVIALSKILPYYNKTVGEALQNNLVVLKSLGGAGNLSHDLADLKHCMCKFVILMDNDKAGVDAAEKAIKIGLATEADIKYTTCPGSPEAEFEDCLQPALYSSTILEKFSVNINCSQFRGNAKWSERMKQVFLSQGSRWTDTIESKVKIAVAQCIPDIIENIDNIIIPQKTGFLTGLAAAIERLIAE